MSNLWFCFSGCSAGGDVVELVRRVDGCSWSAAARALAAIAGCEAAPVTIATPHPQRVARPFRPFIRSLSLDPDVPFLRTRGIAADTARRFEAGAWHGAGFLAGCVAVRLRDPEGRPLGYAGRRLQPGVEGRWKLPPALPRSQLLYNLHRVHGATTEPCGVALVEGPWEAMRLAQINIPVVALLGTHLSLDPKHLLRLFRRVVVLLDGDAAGRQAAVHVVAALSDIDVIRVDLPPGLDPADLADEELRASVRGLFPS